MVKTAFVTGASSGIGQAFARALVERGHDVVLIARDEGRLETLATELRRSGRYVRVLPADLTDGPALARVEAALREEAALSLLVNNAGFGTAGAFAGSDLPTEDRQIRLNVLALVHLTHAALPTLIARREGGLINVSSVQGFMPSSHVATYGSTKAFVNTFTEALATELVGSGVTVQALCPGFTRTEFQSRASIKTDSLPPGAWMTAEAVVSASLAAFDRGELFCVPGAQNQALVGLEKLLPRALTRRLAAALSRRLV